MFFKNFGVLTYKCRKKQPHCCAVSQQCGMHHILKNRVSSYYVLLHHDRFGNLCIRRHIVVPDKDFHLNRLAAERQFLHWCSGQCLFCVRKNTVSVKTCGNDFLSARHIICSNADIAAALAFWGAVLCIRCAERGRKCIFLVRLCGRVKNSCDCALSYKTPLSEAYALFSLPTVIDFKEDI